MITSPPPGRLSTPNSLSPSILSVSHFLMLCTVSGSHSLTSRLKMFRIVSKLMWLLRFPLPAAPFWRSRTTTEWKERYFDLHRSYVQRTGQRCLECICCLQVWHTSSVTEPGERIRKGEYSHCPCTLISLSITSTSHTAYSLVHHRWRFV